MMEDTRSREQHEVPSAVSYVDTGPYIHVRQGISNSLPIFELFYKKCLI